MNKYNCTLYNCKSVNKLQNYLCITNRKYFKELSYNLKENPFWYYKPFEKNNRELFICSNIIKSLHKRLIFLFNVEICSYLKSGVKKESHLTNAKLHENSKFFLLLDIKSFYPSITKNKIKNQLIRTYKQSSNVSEFIANAVTVPQKKALNKRALVTGSVLSQYFAYVINKKMFDELDDLSRKENIIFSVYVDDISFSSKSIIPYKFHQKVYSIVNKYGYKVHNGKVFRGKISNKSIITGIKVTKHGFRLQDKHKFEIKRVLETKEYLLKPKRLEGLLNYALQVNPKYTKYKYIIDKYLPRNKV